MLFLALLVLETSAQSGETLVDDADYESLYSTSGHPLPGEWYEPDIPPDSNWTTRTSEIICSRYRLGAVTFTTITVR